MSALLLELARTLLFLSSSSRLMFGLRMISSMVVLAQHEKVAKTLPVVRLATHKFLVSVDAVVWVELLATALADKHMATVLPNFVLFRRWQRIESLVTDITGMNPLPLFCFVPHTDPIQLQHEIPNKPALNTCRSRCKQMSTPPVYLYNVVV